jgi:hypothetical protein
MAARAMQSKAAKRQSRTGARYTALAQSIVEASGQFGFEQARTEPGLAIGEGTLQHFLKVGAPIVILVAIS